jgi:Tol biopolymer transport system component
MAADGTGQATRLTHHEATDRFPAWSPDGTRIAFSRIINQRGDAGIYVMQADGSASAQITAGSHWAPTWTPDGTKILYSASGILRFVNADGTPVEEQLEQHIDVGYPRLSPDGTKLGFVGIPGSGGGRYTIANADGSDPRVIVTADEGGPFSWSPDSTKIALSTDTGAISVINIDGTQQTNLTTDAGEDGSPAWSPDGSRIAFTSDRAGNNDIHVMHQDGTEQENLTSDSSSDDNSPAWPSRWPDPAND